MKRVLLYLGVFIYLFFSSQCARAQAPNISYTPTTNVFTVGTAITTLTPTNSGGAVPANIYGQVITLAGSTAGTAGYTNATGTAARFSFPLNIVGDAAGNLYVADANNNSIRKITSAGVVSTFAGSTAGTAGFTNATGTAARFSSPEGMAIDGSGNIYVGDFTNNAIRKITPAGVVTTFSTGFNGPAGIGFDGSGNLFVSEQNGNVISKVSSAGVRTVYAGSGTAGMANNANKLLATFNQPIDVQVDGSGNVFVADYSNNQIREITAAGAVVLFAGSATGTAGLTNGTGTAALFNGPTGIAMDAQGNFYISDYANNEIRLMTSGGVVSLLAGSAAGTSGNADGTLTAATFNTPVDMYIDANDVAYVTDGGGNSIRKMYLTGYAIVPTAIPAGLAFDGTTGKISGTPTATSSATNYAITAYNISGSSADTISIQCVQTNNWTAGSNTTAWGTAGNWSKNAVPAANDAVQIGVTAYTNNKQPTLSATTTVSSITFGAAKAGILTISTGNTLTLSNGLTVNNASTATITGGAASSTVLMAAGSIVNVTGTGVLTLTSPMTFTLQSTASGDASIGQIVTGAITGSAATSINVQRYLTGGVSYYRGYRLLSSPVYAGVASGNNVYSINYLKTSIYLTATTTTGGFDNTSAANPTLYLYRENLTPTYTTFTGSNFRGINNINSSPSYTLDVDGAGYNIPVGNGYLCFFRGNRGSGTFAQETATSYVPQSATLNAIGTLNIGQVLVKDWFTPVSTKLSYTAASPVTVRGYNLVGNPYASAINWDLYQHTSTTTGIYGSATLGSTIYVLDPISHNYGAYIAGNGGVGGTNNATNIISSGQAFFVVAGNTTDSLIFNESAKTTTQNTGAKLLMGTPVNYANNQYLKLRLAKDSVNADETVVQFNSQGTINYNQNLDALYRGGYGSVSLSGISKDNVSLAIDVIPLPKLKSETVGLNVTANTDGVYALSLKDIVSVPQLYDLWLMDKYKKDSIDLRKNSTYAFNIYHSDTSSFGANRFSLVIRENAAYAYQLISFTAAKVPNAQQVQVNWNTVNEGNYTYFTVQRSIDGGKTYNVLGDVTASGAGQYGLIDKAPVIGSNMYRLQQQDVNGVSTYSNVVTIQYSDLSNSIANHISLYPNPAVNNLSLAINLQQTDKPSSAYNIRFMNSSGIIVRQITAAQPSWQGSVNNLQPGTYIIQVLNNTNGSLVGQSKFVKL